MNNKTNMIDNQEQGVDLAQLVSGEYKRGFREGQKQAMRELSESLPYRIDSCRTSCTELIHSLGAIKTMSKIISEIRFADAEPGEDLAWLDSDFYLGSLAGGIKSLIDGMQTRVGEMDKFLEEVMACCDTLASHPSRLSSDAGSNQSPNSEESR